MSATITTFVSLETPHCAVNLENLASIPPGSRYRFMLGDICDKALGNAAVEEANPDVIVHFAADLSRYAVRSSRLRASCNNTLMSVW